MKAALVKYKNQRAGLLKETDEGYEFQYDAEYLVSDAPAAVSLTLLREVDYEGVGWSFITGAATT